MTDRLELGAIARAFMDQPLRSAPVVSMLCTCPPWETSRRAKSSTVASRSSRHGEAQGARAWTGEEVQPPAPYRLDRATVSEHSMLDPAASPDQRTSVTL